MPIYGDEVVIITMYLYAGLVLRQTRQLLIRTYSIAQASELLAVMPICQRVGIIALRIMLE